MFVTKLCKLMRRLDEYQYQDVTCFNSMSCSCINLLSPISSITTMCLTLSTYSSLCSKFKLHLNILYYVNMVKPYIPFPGVFAAESSQFESTRELNRILAESHLSLPGESSNATHMTADVLSPASDFIDSANDRLDQTTTVKTASFTHADLQVGFMNTDP